MKQIRDAEKAVKMTKKYEFTDESQVFDGRSVHRIRALVDIPRHGVTAGDLGGWIGGEENLSHSGGCWVTRSALVYRSACVTGDALVTGAAVVKDAARVYGEAVVGGEAWVTDHAQVRGSAVVGDWARVTGSAVVGGSTVVGGTTHVSG